MQRESTTDFGEEHIQPTRLHQKRIAPCSGGAVMVRLPRTGGKSNVRPLLAPGCALRRCGSRCVRPSGVLEFAGAASTPSTQFADRRISRAFSRSGRTAMRFAVELLQFARDVEFEIWRRHRIRMWPSMQGRFVGPNEILSRSPYVQ
jgi:hypothetical protein